LLVGEDLAMVRRMREGGDGGRTENNADGERREGVTAALENALAHIRTANSGLPVRFADDVMAPADDGRYVTIVLLAGGVPVEAVVFTTETFYASLAKVMAAVLPSAGQRPVS
jgi:hypothetical protein